MLFRSRQVGEFVSKFFTRGRMAVVSGRLQIRSWTDKDGNKRRTAEVVADNVYFADSKSEATSAAPQAPVPANYGSSGYSAPSYPASDFQMLEDDDAQLPF